MFIKLTWLQNFFVVEDRTNSSLIACILIYIIIFSLAFAFAVTFSIKSVHPSVDLCLNLLELWILNHLSWNFYNTKVPRSWVKVKRANMSYFPSFCIWLYSKLDWKVKVHFNVRVKLKVIHCQYHISRSGQSTQKYISVNFKCFCDIFVLLCTFLAKRRSCLCFIWEKLKFFHCKMFFIMLKLKKYSKTNTCNIFSCEDLMIRKNSLACTDSCYIAFVQSR